MIKGQQQLIRAFVLLGIILFATSGYLWWTKIYTNPERVFWATLENNLATSSITKQIIDKNSEGVEQYVRMQLGGENIVQTTAKVAADEDVQESETLSTPQTDYIRFTKFVTSQKDTSGKPLNLSKITNVWAKSESETGASQQFSRSVFDGLLPVANLTPQQRTVLMSDFHKDSVLKVDFSSVKKTNKNGRTLYTYVVTKSPAGYVDLLKKLGGYVGLDDLAAVDTSQYKSAAGTVINVTIDAHARQLVSVSLEDESLIEKYSSYGVAVSRELPTKNVVSIDELRTRFNELSTQ